MRLQRLAFGSFLGLEVVFKLVFVRAFGNAFAPVGDHGPVIAKYVTTASVVTFVTLFAIAEMTGRIERAYRSAEPAERGRTIGALRRFPRDLAFVWSLDWCATVLVAVQMPALVSPPAVLCLFVTVGLGAAVLAHALGVWFAEEPLRELSPDRDRVQGSVPTSLARRVAAYGVSICIAPTMYFASLAFSARFAAMSAGELATEVLIQTLATGAFATACAVILSRTIVGPIGRMAKIMQTLAKDDRTSSIERMPLREDDELGTLSEATNHMLERLEESDRERRALLATLEQKVEERTRLLVAAKERIAQDFATRERMELELRQAQRLEAIGRLAAGIAHEINTPVQFVGDSLTFVREAVGDLTSLLEQDHHGSEDVDLVYLREQLPLAIERSLEGVGRVATIVRSLRTYAHPDRTEMTACDLNQAITSTLTIARNEYKYIADLETQLGELPPVTCYVGDFNQVVINLIVNAAHAIADVVGTSGDKGRLTVATRRDGADAIVTVSDTGCGIPAGIRDRVFEPFFTTKPVGKGTGQGLAIAHAVIVEKHQGSLTFETGPRGTTFTIRIPIAGACPTSVVAHLPRSARNVTPSSTLPRT